ncbi:hypothetical protein, partial [Streptomyces sp. NPDC007070]|uniref:hypothetical protein n=1 Tax=Streptomyces sp. NPDC007070 TaxID=3154312 RepID=UPI00340ABB85
MTHTSAPPRTGATRVTSPSATSRAQPRYSGSPNTPARPGAPLAVGFDEFRYFVPGDTMPVLRVHGV